MGVCERVHACACALFVFALCVKCGRGAAVGGLSFLCVTLMDELAGLGLAVSAT